MAKSKHPKPTDLKLQATKCKSVSVNDDLSAVWSLLPEHGSQFIAVLQENRPVGILRIADIPPAPQSQARLGFLAKFKAREIKEKQPMPTIKELMFSDPLIIEYGTDIDTVFNVTFERKDSRLNEDIILVREDGTYFGLISAKAIFRLLYGFLGRHMKELRLEKEKVSFQNSQVVRVQRDLELTNQKLAISRDKAVEGVKMKNIFLANMSHEIRTPMNGVFGMIDLLYDTELDKDQEQLVSTARSSAETLMRIINDILDFSKIEAGKVSVEMMPFCLTEMVESSVALYAEAATEKDVELSLTFEDSPPWVVGDPYRYQQVLNNLISNAIKFTDSGSVQVVVIGLGAEDGGQILTEVIDTGIGIPKDKLSKLFQPFTQVDESTVRKYGGTGLGLSICDNLVELLGGKLDCDSKVNQGTCFSFSLPFAYYEDPEANVPSECVRETHRCSTSKLSDRSDFSGIKVLLVEDNIVNQEVAKRFLSKLNCDVDFAENGRVAMDYLRSDAYDCVFMDCQMPIMDGYETTKLIRSGEVSDNCKDVFISAMTAHAMSGDRESCLEVGMDHYFSKPFCLLDFRKALILSTEKAAKLYDHSR